MHNAKGGDRDCRDKEDVMAKILLSRRTECEVTGKWRQLGDTQLSEAQKRSLHSGCVAGGEGHGCDPQGKANTVRKRERAERQPWRTPTLGGRSQKHQQRKLKRNREKRCGDSREKWISRKQKTTVLECSRGQVT